MNAPMDDIAAQAAALVVEEGLDYASAKRKAIKQMGLSLRTALPSNDLLHEQVQAYIALYCADSQGSELTVLREMALLWMERIQQLTPQSRIYISGAVWLGTATRLSDIHLQVFCDDPKALEISLINAGVHFEAVQTTGFQRLEVPSLLIHLPCPALQVHIGLQLSLYGLDNERGARLPGLQGQPMRGDAKALRQRISTQSEANGSER